MPALLTAASTMMCPHGGTVTAIPSQTRATAGAPILLGSDTFLVAGCPFNVGLRASPCLTVQWVVTATRVTGRRRLRAQRGERRPLPGGHTGSARAVLIVQTQPEEKAYDACLLTGAVSFAEAAMIRRDILYPFAIDAASGQAAQTDYASHVEQMIVQVLLTDPGERVCLPTFGAGLRRLLFAPMNSSLGSTTKIIVTQALNQWLSDQIMVKT